MTLLKEEKFSHQLEMPGKELKGTEHQSCNYMVLFPWPANLHCTDFTNT